MLIVKYCDDTYSNEFSVKVVGSLHFIKFIFIEWKITCSNE